VDEVTGKGRKLHNEELHWCMRVSVFATVVLQAFIVTTTTCFSLRPSSGGINIEYTNGNFAKLIVDALLEQWFFFYYWFGS
jgi:hypothetical protein